jgi:hypothetical protein
MPPPYPIGLPSRNHDQRAVRFCSTGINLLITVGITRRVPPQRVSDPLRYPAHAR